MSAMTWAASDAWVLTKRNLTVWARVPAYLVFTVVQPTIFTLLFRYVFGGAIPTEGFPGGYVNYLLPGVIGQTAAFATMATAISLAIEAQKGVIDRLRVMPIARSASSADRSSMAASFHSPRLVNHLLSASRLASSEARFDSNMPLPNAMFSWSVVSVRFPIVWINRSRRCASGLSIPPSACVSGSGQCVRQDCGITCSTHRLDGRAIASA